MSVSWGNPFTSSGPGGFSSGASTWTLPAYTTSPFESPTPAIGYQQYVYDQRPSRSGQVAYDPTMRGQSYDSLSGFLGWQTITSQVDSWLMREHPEYFQFPQGNVPIKPGEFGSPGGDWAQVDSWNGQILEAQNAVYQQTGVYVPGNVIKAIMKIESNGVWLDTNYAGATGLMQVTPNSMGSELYDFSKVNSDPAYNIWAGTMELALRYQDAINQNPAYTWSNVAVGYFSGHYEPDGSGDRWNTDYRYQQMFDEYMGVLSGVTTGSGGPVRPGTGNPGTGRPAGDITAFLSTTGGLSFPISQEMGGNAMNYSNYDYTLGVKGHPGIDIATPVNTRTYSPVFGTVVTAGGSGYFLDWYAGNSPQTGELKIKMDNGDEIILGHMASISVQVGQRVSPGMQVGVSGTGGDPSTHGGPHIHMEYRRYGSYPWGNFQALDPRSALAGDFTGSFSETPGIGVSPNIAYASDWQNFMKAAASGGILAGSGIEPAYGGSMWGSWLRRNAEWIPAA